MVHLRVCNNPPPPVDPTFAGLLLWRRLCAPRVQFPRWFALPVSSRVHGRTCMFVPGRPCPAAVFAFVHPCACGCSTPSTPYTTGPRTIFLRARWSILGVVARVRLLNTVVRSSRRQAPLVSAMVGLPFRADTNVSREEPPANCATPRDDPVGWHPVSVARGLLPHRSVAMTAMAGVRPRPLTPDHVFCPRLSWWTALRGCRERSPLAA